MPPMPTVLCPQTNGSGRALYRLQGGVSLSGSLGTLGTASPTYSTLTNNYGWQVPWDDAVEFNGDIYAVIVEDDYYIRVFRRTPDNNVTVVASHYGSFFTVTHGYEDNLRTGIYVVNDGSTRYLCTCFYSRMDGTWRMLRSIDGITWTYHVLGAGNTNPKRSGVAVHRGQLIVPVDHQVLLINVATASMSTITHSFGIGGASILPFKGRIFMHMTRDGNYAQLYELSGGSFISRANISLNNSPAGNTNTQNMPCLFPVKDVSFTDGIKMVCIFLDYTSFNGNWHWRAVDIDVDDNTFTVTPRDGLIPIALRNGGVASNKHFYGWGCFVDNESDPLNPQPYLFSWPTYNSAFTHYEYVNSSSELVGQSVGLNSTNFALSGTRWGGGDRINTSDLNGEELMITKCEVTPGTTAGTTLLTVRATGDPGDATKRITGYFSTTETPDMTQMTLIGTPTGGSATRNGNTIENIDADGVTDYTFVWASVITDGVSPNQQVNILIRIEH